MSTRYSLALRWTIALLVGLTVAALSFQRYPGPIPNPIRVEVTLDPLVAGKSEPLITTGRVQAGDFVFVRYLDEHTLLLGYEAWGAPPLLSAPIRLPDDRRLALDIEMPALTQVQGVFAPTTDRIRIVANGTEALNATVNYHVRLPHEITFAENRLGGSACDASLHGKILLPGGAELRGYPTALSTFRHRLVGFILISRWQALAAAILMAGVFVGLGHLQRSRPAAANVANTPVGLGPWLWRHRWFWLTSLVATVAFSAMVSYGTFKFIYPERFSDFYDHQAVSLLHGKLDVPDEAISGEAFIYRGKRYGYFGLTPAILRLPLVIFDLYFGQLSRGFMVLYFIGTLVGCYLTLATIHQLAGRRDSAPSAWATLVFVGGCGLGSTVFFLGSRAYVYHEAILSGIMFAMLGCWCALRHYGAPDRRWWVGSLICGILSVHARPPTGLFALTLLGALAIAALVRLPEGGERAALIRRQLLIGALCGVGVLTFNGVSYLKFGTFEGCPLRYNVQYDATRIARIEGKQFHLVNLPVAVDSYLLERNFRFEAGFPFFYIGNNRPHREWANTKIDYHDNTLGFPYAMPSLCLLGVLGAGVGWVMLRELRLAIAATWAAGVPMSLAMFCAIAITHRYTADFCPFLFVAAAWGVVAIEQLPCWRRLVLKPVVGTVTLIAVLITAAITLHHQGHEVWGVPDDVHAKYAALRKRIDATVGGVGR